jgi:hypothetical protein
MKTRQAAACRELAEDVNRYAWGELSGQSAAVVEAHLACCESCKDLVAFMKEFDQAGQGRTPGWEDSGEPCPTTDLLASVEANLADEEDAKHVRAHTVHCRECAEKFLVLRGLRNKETAVETPQAAVKTDPDSFWQKCLARAQQCVIDLVTTYNPDTLLGAFRIVGPVPALATRGSAPSGPLATVIEAPLGKNVYGIALTAEQGGLSLDIAGYQIAERLPITLTVFSDDGIQLASVRTDVSGNARLVLVRASIPTRNVVIAISLADDIWEAFLLSIP